MHVKLGVCAAIVGILLGCAWLARPVRAEKFRPGELASVKVIIRGLGEEPPARAFREAKVRDPLYTRYFLRTQVKEKARLQFADGTVLNINQRTDAVLRDPLHTTVNQGEVDQVDAHGTVHHITANGAVATANGTNFDVKVVNGRVFFVVDRGRVTVRSGGAAVTLRRNQESIVSAHRKPGRPRHVNADAVIAWTRGLDTDGWSYVVKSTSPGAGTNKIVGALTYTGGYLLGINTTGTGAPHISEITATGRFVRAFGPSSVTALATGPANRIYGLATQRILEYSLTGRRVGTISLPAQASNAGSIAVDARGNVWVTYAATLPGQPSLVKLSPGGSSLATVTGSYQDAAVDKHGNLYAVETTPTTSNGIIDHICKFSPTGQQLACWSVHGPHGALPQFDALAVDLKGRIFAAAEYSNSASQQGGSIYELSARGKLRTIWGGAGGAITYRAGAFTYPGSIAVDSAGNVYVTENYSIQELPWFDT